MATINVAVSALVVCICKFACLRVPFTYVVKCLNVNDQLMSRCENLTAGTRHASQVMRSAVTECYQVAV
jgi:hypothetical protein